MNTLRVAVFTQGGLGIEISRRVARLPGVELAGIFCERPLPRRRPFPERIARHVKYYGYAGTLVRAAKAVLRRVRPAPQSLAPDDAPVLQAIAAECAAGFYVASDLHDPTILETVRSLRPDLGLVIGTTIVKASLYDLPRLGSLNIHQGTVPEYRGSAPAFWALFNNESEYGVTIHRVVDRVDAGDVVLSETVPFHYDFARYGVDFEEFLDSFEDSLGPLSIDLMVEAVRRVAQQTHSFTSQDESKAVRRRMPTHSQVKELRRRLRQRFVGAPADACRS